MEFTEEFIKDNGLSTEQVTALTTATNDNEATLKQGWDGLANTNAEKIISGATSLIAESLKVTRNEGEKAADYIVRAQKESFSSKESDYVTKMAELEEKMKTAGSDEALKGEYSELKGKYSTLQQKEASFDELMNSGVKDKYDTLLESNTKLNLEVSFNSVKPNFPDTVNSYEAMAKWNEFKSTTLEKYHIKIVENEALAIDKENEHKIVKLKDLLGADTNIKSLLEGRQQTGPNGLPVSKGKVEGVPFDVPEDAKTNAKSRAEAIREYLAKENISIGDARHVKMFKEFNDKITKQQTA